MVEMEYNKNIVGRRYEQEVLHACVESTRAEFIAVYGRRRIGKTFLVKQFFNDTFFALYEFFFFKIISLLSPHKIAI